MKVDECQMLEFSVELMDKSIDGFHLALVMKMCFHVSQNSKDFLLNKFAKMSQQNKTLQILNVPSLLLDVTSQYFSLT